MIRAYTLSRRLPALIALFALMSAERAIGVPPSDVMQDLAVPVRLNAGGIGAALETTDAGTTATGGPYAASNVALLSQVTLADFGQSRANDIWGYVSPSGREYAIVGLQAAVGFVEITDPQNPVIVGTIGGTSSTWRDMRTYDHYAYAVIDNIDTGLGMQVIDLSQIDSGLVTLHATITDGGFENAHNIALNLDSGYAYTVGGTLDGGGITAWDIATDPASPSVVGNGWSESSVHDIFVTTYTSGPYAGQEIAFAFAGGNGLIIIDVTDKDDMTTLGSLQYPTLAYCHQGWLTPDKTHVVLDDEVDELQNFVDTTTTYIVDVGDLSDPQLVTTFTTGLPAIDHNLYVRGPYVFEANYASGLRIFDISDFDDIQQIGFFDTRPEDDAVSFNGAWGAYPFLPSGVVIVSDRDRGLFILDTTDATGPVTAVPTVSQWGTIIMTLLLMSAATVLFARRRNRAHAPQLESQETPQTAG